MGGVLGGRGWEEEGGLCHANGAKQPSAMAPVNPPKRCPWRARNDSQNPLGTGSAGCVHSGRERTDHSLP